MRMRHIIICGLPRSIIFSPWRYTTHSGCVFYSPLSGFSLLAYEVTWSHTHSDAPQSVRLLWTNDQFVAETSTWQHTTLTTDKHPCPGWDSNPRSQQASGRRPTARLLGPAHASTIAFKYKVGNYITNEAVITVRIKSNPYQSQITDTVTAPSKAWVCGRSFAGIAVSNPAGLLDICPPWMWSVDR